MEGRNDQRYGMRAFFERDPDRDTRHTKCRRRTLALAFIHKRTKAGIPHYAPPHHPQIIASAVFLENFKQLPSYLENKITFARPRSPRQPDPGPCPKTPRAFPGYRCFLREPSSWWSSTGCWEVAGGRSHHRIPCLGPQGCYPQKCRGWIRGTTNQWRCRRFAPSLHRMGR